MIAMTHHNFCMTQHATWNTQCFIWTVSCLIPFINSLVEFWNVIQLLCHCLSTVKLRFPCNYFLNSTFFSLSFHYFHQTIYLRKPGRKWKKFPTITIVLCMPMNCRFNGRTFSCRFPPTIKFYSCCWLQLHAEYDFSVFRKSFCLWWSVFLRLEIYFIWQTFKFS